MSIVLTVVLLLANGLFVAVEFALLASLRGRIEEEASTWRGRVALRTMTRLGPALAGAQLGITLASLALGAVAEPAFDHFLDDLLVDLSIPESWARTVALVLALTVITFLHLVIGEMVPKSIALARPERTLLGLSLPVGGFLWLFGPVIWVLNRLASIGSRLVGVEPADELRSTANAAELGLMIEESREEGLIEEDDHELLVAALGFMHRSAGEVMVPRNDIGAIPRSLPVADAEAAMRRSGHSRLLLVGRGLDDVLGFVHAKDLLQLGDGQRDRPVPLDSVRPLLHVRADQGLGEVLLAMRRARRHVALVVAPDRATLGLVTMEDVLEEIVGDIIDETDRS